MFSFTKPVSSISLTISLMSVLYNDKMISSRFNCRQPNNTHLHHLRLFYCTNYQFIDDLILKETMYVDKGIPFSFVGVLFIRGSPAYRTQKIARCYRSLCAMLFFSVSSTSN
ncbi:uncharacterized protein LOC110937033 isoform X2 [Helianthus annuus]|uniref:uncharacterized protein LOC110937033 isoform X2 n=1 Tax=Helianthus annuus TaxID=4232 RepID=UPI001652FA92|nr:uncharacterized protein LOC110937033 isoform X2 [Helianthus annuus]